MPGKETEPIHEMVVRFKVHPGVGGPGSWRHGSLIEMLQSLPYAFATAPQGIPDPIPPFTAINSLLSSGGRVGGMSGGCEWKPFQISREQYDELVLELLTLPDSDFVVGADSELELPYEDWVSHRLKQFGIDIEKMSGEPDS